MATTGAWPGIRVNPDAAVRREAISDTDACVIVDDFLHDPDALIEFAAGHAAEFAEPARGFPGVRLLLAETATADIHRFIRIEMTKQFPFFRGSIKLRSLLSMVTLQPDQLSSLQRVCHADPNPDPDRARYAGVVYLFHDETLGGTSFYRWRDRDLIWRAADIAREDPAKGHAFLREHFQTFREPPRYMTESNEIAERLCTIPARFNRLIFYSGDVPHSGAITAPERLSRDVRQGRLTLNLFAGVLAK